MNPLTNMRNVTKLSERELKYNDGKTSWHDEYRDSAWIFIGGLPYDLSEGDVLAVFSQYGEIVNINLCRDKGTGKSKGFGFVCFEDQRSTILTVDNLNGIKLLGRSIRVDHVKDYKPPKDSDKLDDITRTLQAQGCAPNIALSGIYDAAPPSDEDEQDLIPYHSEEKPLLQIKNEPSNTSHTLKFKIKSESTSSDREDKDDGKSRSKRKHSKVSKKSKKIKKHKSKSRKEKKHRKRKRQSSSSSSSESSSSS